MGTSVCSVSLNMHKLSCSTNSCCYYVSSEEFAEYVEIGSLNGLFVLGRTIGFIGEC